MKNKISRLFSFVIIADLALLLDQATKNWALLKLKDSSPVVLIRNVLELLYTENNGAAFGILKGKQVFFYLITLVVILFILYVIIRMPFERKYTPLFVDLTFIFSGAVGNLIDRAARKYVIDFIYYMPINFPVFNVADIYVTISTAVLVLLLIFHYREDDLKFIFPKGHGEKS